MTTMEQSQSSASGLDALPPGERQRLEARRDASKQARPVDRADLIGLALSGGGIRSATFSLGLLQSLAKTQLLARIDYLSTVSGGGYIGAFLCSLYKRRPADLKCADSAPDLTPSEVLNSDFSRRWGGADPSPGWSLQWLRKSSRYLAPSGAGDFMYALALGVRNLVAVHYVIGLCLFTLLLFASTINVALVHLLPEARTLAVPEPVRDGLVYLALAVLLMFFWVLPSGLAYFMVQPQPLKPSLIWWRLPSYLAFFALTFLLAAVLLAWTVNWQTHSFQFEEPARLLKIAAGFALLALASSIVFFHLALRKVMKSASKNASADPTQAHVDLVPGTRVLLTQYTATGLQTVAAVLGLGLLLSLASWLLDEDVGKSVTKLGALAGGLIAALRTAISLLPKRKKDTEPSPALYDLAIGLGGFAALIALALIWAALALSTHHMLAATGEGTVLYGMLATLLILSLLTGNSFQFLNLTSIQQLYASRIVRAYLGATNAARVRTGGNAWQSISDPHPKDNMPLSAYYAADVGPDCPLHLINVTINQTIAPTDPLVQRDRKGRPLTVGPTMMAVDGRVYPYVGPNALPPCEQLSVGSWIGISGAAFSTGLGRATTLGKAILFTLANVRLGYWWSAWVPRTPPQVGQNEVIWWLRSAVKRLFRTQAHLIGEMFGRFDGTQSRYWYLSDGGHFENTGVYELLRRQVGLVIASDNGADPDYELEDLANLFRLARIDFGMEFLNFSEAELLIDPRLASLAPLLANPEVIDRGNASNQRCLMLYWAYRPDALEQGTALLVIKPRLVAAAPSDVHQYASVSATFPQETTADQFFNEAQWESYRRLAQCIGDQVLIPLSSPQALGDVRAGLLAQAVQRAASA